MLLTGRAYCVESIASSGQRWFQNCSAQPPPRLTCPRYNRSGIAGSRQIRFRDCASTRSRCRRAPRQMAHGVSAKGAPSPSPPSVVPHFGLSTASRSPESQFDSKPVPTKTLGDSHWPPLVSFSQSECTNIAESRPATIAFFLSDSFVPVTGAALFPKHNVASRVRNTSGPTYRKMAPA
jgi:hypothetical protein